MNNKLALNDVIVLLFTSRLLPHTDIGCIEEGREHDVKGFFLAEGSLTGGLSGLLLLHQTYPQNTIGMSGNGYFVGIAVSAYEWIAAISLIIIAIWFMPIYLKAGSIPCRSF
jgi:SSS family solute:Na+ symporter